MSKIETKHDWHYLFDCQVCEVKTGIIVMEDIDELPNYCPMCGEYLDADYHKIE